MKKEDLVGAVWELTRPADEQRARKYLEALEYLISVPKVVWFQPPFHTTRKRRLIVPVSEELRIVQWVLADWIWCHFRLGDDYCRCGKHGVFEAVKKHQRSNHALVFDLRNAYESVTATMIFEFMVSHLPGINEEVIKRIVEFLTHRGRLRQGFPCAPIVYNMIITALDEELERIRIEFGADTRTRYVDDICFSKRGWLDLRGLENRVRKAVAAHGFGISKLQRVANKPFVYLGIQIYQGDLSLAPEKYQEFCERIAEATTSAKPRTHRRHIAGTLGWARQVYGDSIPEDLQKLFDTYDIALKGYKRRMF